MAVDRDEVLKISELAKLTLEPEALEQFTGQFQSILDYVEQLKEVNVEGIEPTSHVSLARDFEKHIFREDCVGESLPADQALANAPDAGCGQFRVPRVIQPA